MALSATRSNDSTGMDHWTRRFQRRGCLSPQEGALPPRIATKEQRQIAQRICDALSDRIAPLRAKLLAEFKNELLEVRKGRVEAVEPTTGEETPRERRQ